MPNACKDQGSRKRKLAEPSECGAVIVQIPQKFYDEVKWMDVVFRNEMLTLIAWESEYDFYGRIMFIK